MSYSRHSIFSLFLYTVSVTLLLSFARHPFNDEKHIFYFFLVPLMSEGVSSDAFFDDLTGLLNMSNGFYTLVIYIRRQVLLTLLLGYG